MEQIFSRNELYWGEGFQKFLASKTIFIFGLGGVGGFCLEALVRSGIENFTLIDFDTVSKSNINRQLIALNSTIGIKKTELFKKRLKDINDNVNLRIFDDFYDESLNDEIFSFSPDFVVDAIDSLKSKIKLIKYSTLNNINLITSFGAGNRLDCSQLVTTKANEIKSNDQFIKNVLSKLKKENVELNFPVVWSKEKAHSLKKIKNIEKIEKKSGEIIELTKYTPASTPMVPAVCGYLMANYVIKCVHQEYELSKK